MSDDRTTAKQARLPAKFHAPTIAAMEFGQPRYTVPWAMWPDADGLLWLHPDYPAEDRPGGTVSMRIELREDGYHVWPVPGHAYTPTAASAYAGRPSQAFIPVAVLEGPRPTATATTSPRATVLAAGHRDGLQ